MKITKAQAKKLANEFDINLNIVDIDEFHFGLNVELEHGSKFGKITNITSNNINITCKIVIAHLLEDHRYYHYLRQMEAKRDKYWKTHKKPYIFNE